MSQRKEVGVHRLYGAPFSRCFERLVIAKLLPVETRAIVEATATEIRSRRGAIMLRLWHHVGDGAARAMLFEDFALSGRSLGLIEAIVCTAGDGCWGGRLPRGADAARVTWTEEVTRLERAFDAALVDVFGPRAPPMVRHAWRDALRTLLDTGALARRDDPAARALGGEKEHGMADEKRDGVSDTPGGGESQGGHWPGKNEAPAEGEAITHNVTENKPARNEE